LDLVYQEYNDGTPSSLNKSLKEIKLFMKTGYLFVYMLLDICKFKGQSNKMCWTVYWMNIYADCVLK